MGSRSYRRLCRRARAEIRRARREAMIGACNDVVAHLRERIELNHARALGRMIFPGIDGLMPLEYTWPPSVAMLIPPRVAGTIGGRARANPLLRHVHAVDCHRTPTPEERKKLTAWWDGTKVLAFSSETLPLGVRFHAARVRLP